MPEKIGFVGVGRMGANMARRLKDCGYPIGAVYDVNLAGAATLALELGCPIASDLKTVTASCDVIFTVVSDDKAMKSIFNDSLLNRAKGKLFINCATVSPDIHVWVEKKCESKGASSLETCMASSITQARDGTLYLMCGGKPEVFERARPILAAAPRSAARAPRLMSAAYSSLLDNMMARGFAPPRIRARPSRIRVLGALLYYGLL